MKKSCLIADSGATKAEWVLLHNGEVAQQFYTAGINVTYATDDEILHNIAIVKSRIAKELLQSLQSVVFYGAGCANVYKATHLSNMLQSAFPQATVSVYSDLLGACHALCGNASGWVAILGTGSASCLYNGKEMTLMTPSLGFLLGDEGSGTYLGKLFLKAYLMNRFSQTLKHHFESKFQLSPALVFDKLYRQPHLNRFISSFAPYIMEKIDEPLIMEICRQNFEDFIQLNLSFSSTYPQYKLHLLGSVAYYFRDIIADVTKQYHIELGNVEAAPMPRLIEMYNASFNE